MAYFAKIENNLVTDMIKIDNNVCGEPYLTFPDTELSGQAFIFDTLKFEGEWLQTSYNGNFRGCYAGIGYTWNGTNFVAPVVEPD